MNTLLSQRSLSELLKSATTITFSRALTILYKYSTTNQLNCHNKHENDPKSLILTLFTKIKQDGSPHILNKIISLCSKFHLFDAGIQLHATVIKLGFTSNVYICSALVDFYGKCCRIGCARKVFDEMPDRNVVTWNSLITGCLMGEIPEVAVGLFVGMLREGIVLTAFGASSALVACTQLDASELGVQIHGLCLKNGVLWNVVVGTGLVDMYAKCWSLEEARRVFECLEERNDVTWTTMIAGCAQYKLPYEAMNMFREMQRLGHRPSHVIFNTLLSSFSGREHLNHCKQIHCHIVREGLESGVYIQISLVTVYAECKCSLEDFERICSCVERWDQVSWNALIAGFSHLEHNEKALICFSNMRRCGVACDFITLTSIVRVTGIISCLEVGQQVHALALKIGSASNLHVQNGLVSMYGRCGVISDTKKVFFAMKEHDLISWNSLLAGFCHHGYGHEVVKLFEAMRRTGIQPDQNTFLCVISACSHSGLLKEGLQYFDLLNKLFPCGPISMDIYASIVDMYGRAGYIYEAEAFISNMTVTPGPSIYKSLLGACKLHGNIEVGGWASRRLLEQCPNDIAAFVLFSNSLSRQGCWDEAERVWKLVDQRRGGKRPGCSWVE